MSETAEKLEDLPNGWESRLVKDMLVIEDGDRGSNYPKKSDFTAAGFCLFLNTKNVRPNGFLFEEKQFISKEKHEKLRKGKLERGDIIFTSRGTIGNIAYYDERLEYECVRINSGMFIIREFQKYLTEKYLEYYLRSPYVHGQIGKLKSGSAQPQLPIGDFKKLKIKFPKEKEQQKRIVAKIEELFSHIDAGIEAIKKAKQLLKQYRQSVLKAAVTGELTKEWREANKDKLEPAPQLLERILKERRQKWEEQQVEQFKAKGKMPKDDKWKGKYKDLVLPFANELEVIPREWGWVSWETVLSNDEGSFKRGPFGSALKKSIFVESGYKVYEQYCPINDDCSYARYYITEEKYKELKKFSVKAGDFLISCSGSLGRITQVPNNYEEGVINQALLRVRLNHNVMDDKYFKMLVRSPYFQAQIYDNVAGVAIPNVKGVKDLKAIAIPLPSLAEQLIIYEKVNEKSSSIERLEVEVDAQLIKAEKNKQSILASAFSGLLEG